jgi:hypothetical protein
MEDSKTLFFLQNSHEQVQKFLQNLWTILAHALKKVCFASPDLVELCLHSWWGVTVSNFFMSIALAEELFKKRYNSNGYNTLQPTRSHMNFFHTPNGKGTKALLGKKKYSKIFGISNNIAPDFLNLKKV